MLRIAPDRSVLLTPPDKKLKVDSPEPVGMGTGGTLPQPRGVKPSLLFGAEGFDAVEAGGSPGG